jgi:hypothetical protein
VGVGREIAHGGGVPVIAARQAHAFVHPLLHDGPLALTRYDERMQVDLEAVGDRVVVDARRQPARAHERLAVDTRTIGDAAEFVGGPT